MITIKDNRTELEKFDDGSKEFLQLCKDKRASLKSTEQFYLENIQFAKENKTKIFCFRCGKEIAKHFNYNSLKIIRHLSSCKNQLIKLGEKKKP